MRYPGGKGGAGVFQTIINQIPPHRVYIEPFVGGGNVFERKAPAASSVLMDADPATAHLWRSRCVDFAPCVTVLQGDAISFLESYPWVGDEFVYCDPPYLHSTRKDVSIYRYELDESAHVRLLAALASLPIPFALSGYRSELYDDAARLHNWRRVDFTAMTRRGPATESLWMNYEAPAVIADYAHLGAGYRERERIKRKVARWVARWQQLPALERNAIKAAMVDGPRQECRSSRLVVSGVAVPPGSGAVQLAMEYSA